MLRIFIWGTGMIADLILNQANVLGVYEILGYIDNNSEKCGKTFRGEKIFSPAVLNDIIPDKIIILTDYFDEIRRQIDVQFPIMTNLVEDKTFFFRQSILCRYKSDKNPEIQKVLEHIEEDGLQVFNYNFVDKYKHRKIDVKYDLRCKMFYVYHKNKKLYFARFLDTETKVKQYYLSLLIEQDEESPHRYLMPEFDVKDGDVVVDVGVGEGNFSLDIINKVSKIYLIEADEAWIEAIKETFKEYQEKIVIISRFATSIDEGKYATLDQLIEEPVDFIKMDIEGNEWDALLGAKNLICRSERIKCAICSYHSDFDEILIKNVLESYGLNCSTTQGYMWHPDMLRRSYISLKLCRGIVQGIK